MRKKYKDKSPNIYNLESIESATILMPLHILLLPIIIIQIVDRMKVNNAVVCL